MTDRRDSDVKLAYVANSAIPSSAANSIQVMHTCEAFARRGCDVTLLVPDRSTEVGDQLTETDSNRAIYDFYGVEPCFDVVKLPRTVPSSPGTLLVNRRIGREAAHINADIVYGRSLFACYAAARAGCQTVYEAHLPVGDTRFGRVKTAVFSRLVASDNFHTLVVISEALRQYYADQYDVAINSIVVARNCAKAGSDDIEPVSLGGNSREKRLQVGYVGNLYPGRGIDLIGGLAARMPDIDVHVIGGDPDEVDHWNDEFGHVDNLTFHGFVPQGEIERYRRALDVLLAPYQWDLETRSGYNTVEWMSPLKVAEYMAAGRAIVASDLPALREVLADEEVALLCDPDDIDAWVEAIERLQTNETLRTKLGERARERFENRFTIESRVNRLVGHIAPDVRLPGDDGQAEGPPDDGQEVRSPDDGQEVRSPDDGQEVRSPEGGPVVD